MALNLVKIMKPVLETKQAFLLNNANETSRITRLLV